MVTVLNRKELMSTFDMKRQSEVRDILAQHRIDYDVKTNDPYTALGSAANYGRSAVIVGRPRKDIKYTIYVKRKDFELAWALVNGRLD